MLGPTLTTTFSTTMNQTTRPITARTWLRMTAPTPTPSAAISAVTAMDPNTTSSSSRGLSVSADSARPEDHDPGPERERLGESPKSAPRAVLDRTFAPGARVPAWV